MATAIRITEASKKLFLEYAHDAGNWSGEPLVGGNVGGTKEERGNLTQLKRAGLITTFTEKRDGLNGGSPTLTWLRFTAAGKAYAEANGVDTIDWM